jgi:hypothetical protein
MQKLKFDNRMVNINLKRGTLTEDELKQHRESQPDEADKTERFNLEEDIKDAASMETQSENTQEAASPFVEDHSQMNQGMGQQNNPFGNQGMGNGDPDQGGSTF